MLMDRMEQPALLSLLLSQDVVCPSVSPPAQSQNVARTNVVPLYAPGLVR